MLTRAHLRGAGFLFAHGLIPPMNNSNSSTRSPVLMSSSRYGAPSVPPTHTITLAGGHHVQIVASPGLSESDLRNAVDSALFKNWLKNMQSETGILAGGEISLRQVLIQGVDMFGRGAGFLKFKADVLDKETGTKVKPNLLYGVEPEQQQVPFGGLKIKIGWGTMRIIFIDRCTP